MAPAHASSPLSRRRWLCWAAAGLLTPAQAARAAKPTASHSALPPTASPVAAPAPWPAGADYAISGSFKGFPYSASGSLVWQRDGATYKATSTYQVPLVGKRTQISTGVVGGNGLVPQRFEEPERRNGVWVIDPALQAQDKLSVLLQLGWLQRHRQPAAASGQAVTIPVGKRADPWRFEALGVQTVATALGDLPTQAWLRRAPDDDDTQVEVWYSPSHGHWPVRIRLSQGGADAVDQVLSAWRA